jgi:hypothetical protein
MASKRQSAVVFDAKDDLFGPEVDFLVAKALLAKVREGDPVAIAWVTKNRADLRSLTEYVSKHAQGRRAAYMRERRN